MGRVRREARFATVLGVALAGGPGFTLVGAMDATAASLIENGSFTEGKAGVPSGWRTEAWAPELSRFEWDLGPDGTGAISITSPRPNDARWCQKARVQPGAVYRVSARVKTRDVGTEAAGALIAIEPRVADTRDIRGTNDWQRIETVAQAKDEETAWDICARLGSYANLNTGTAWFTDVALVQLRPAAARAPWWQLLRASLRTQWFTIALPLGAGLLLAFGFGIVRSPRSWQG